MYCCGLRPAEARRLRVNDVDLDIGRLNIMESKQHRSRIVMMADDVTKMLLDCNAIVTSAMPEREPFFPNSEGGFEGFHFHQLRHTYTSNLLSNGAAPKDVQELLGHSDVSTTMNVYAHATREAKRTSARLLDKVTGND